MTDPTVRFLALLELAGGVEGDGPLPEDVQEAIRLIANGGGQGTNGAQFSLEGEAPTFEEHFGSEAPGPGWVFTGEGRWVRGKRKPKPKVLLKGGDVPDEEFDEEQLRVGMLEETEHTDDLELAKQIAKGHLVSDPSYYRKLKKIEGD